MPGIVPVAAPEAASSPSLSPSSSSVYTLRIRNARATKGNCSCALCRRISINKIILMPARPQNSYLSGWVEPANAADA